MHGQGFAGGRKAQRAELGGSCKGSWAGQGGNTQIEAQCIPTSHGRSIADANALPGVLHAIAQRRPRAHFRAGDDTAELAILPPPRDRDRSRVAALYVGKLSLLGGLSHKARNYPSPSASASIVNHQFLHPPRARAQTTPPGQLPALHRRAASCRQRCTR